MRRMQAYSNDISFHLYWYMSYMYIGSTVRTQGKKVIDLKMNTPNNNTL